MDRSEIGSDIVGYQNCAGYKGEKTTGLSTRFNIFVILKCNSTKFCLLIGKIYSISLYEYLLSGSSAWSEVCFFLSELRLDFNSCPVNHSFPPDLTDDNQQRNSTAVSTFLQISFLRQFY